MTTSTTIESYEIAVDQAQLDDLQYRLDHARWPVDLPDAGWTYGTEQAFLRGVVDRWRDGYDWRATEAELNSWGSFVTVAAGQRVHFLHTRSATDDAIPLVLVHGWPGSIVEFLDALPELVKQFHVVVVSMPGYGFSGPTSQRGVDVTTVAAAVAEVMAQLGYERYLAQGGDWGAVVVRHLGERYAPNVAAIHSNMLFAAPTPDDTDPMAGVTEAELAGIGASAERLAEGTAYMKLQGTRPHSLGYGLDDSPLGLAGWILEKFHAWCDIRDGISIRPDRLIDNLMMYWLTGTGTSAARLYYESDHTGTGVRAQWTGRVDVPTGYAVYPYELLATPRVWAEKRYNLVHYTRQDRGGHFAAFEQPDLFTADLTAYGERLRELGVF